MWLSCKLIPLVIFAKPKKSMRLSKDHTHSIYGSVIPLKHVKPVLRYPFTLICVSIFFFSFYNNVVILLLSTIHTCAFSLVEAVWTELSVRLSISSSHCLFAFVSSPSACLRLRYVCLSFPCPHLDCTGFVPLNLLLHKDVFYPNNATARRHLWGSYWFRPHRLLRKVFVLNVLFVNNNIQLNSGGHAAMCGAALWLRLKDSL